MLSAVIANEAYAAWRGRAEPADERPGHDARALVRRPMTLPDVPVAFYPVAVLAILLTGISKGGFAGGRRRASASR